MQVTDLSATSLVGVVVMVFAPLLVALLTKASWPGWVRSIVLLAISGAVGVGNAFIGNPEGWKPGLVIVNAVIAFVIGVASYFGYWEKTSLPDKLKAVGVSDKGTYDISSLPARGTYDPGIDYEGRDS